MPTTYNVLKLDTHYYVMGLAVDPAWSISGEERQNTMLLAQHIDGDWDSPYNSKLMHSCLYDLVQCDSRLKDGDEFVTPHGLFRVTGFHVEPVIELASEKKTRRARLRRLARRTK